MMKGSGVINRVFIRTATITLEGFLKWSRAMATGGQAKHLIQSGFVKVNGETETRRSRKLYPGDVVELPEGERMMVCRQEEPIQADDG